MSNLEDSAPVEEQAPSPDAPVGEAVVEAPEAPVEDAPVAEPELLDTSEIGDRHVKVKVDGEEIVVPLNEALQGYQRQADYSRKTQELAQQRSEAEQALALAKAVEQNPGLTMTVLAQRAGLSVEQFLGLSNALQQEIATHADPEPEFSDPLEKALHDERQARIALEDRINAREADEYLRQSTSRLQAQYEATPDEIRSVVQQALDMNVGPDMFPMIRQAQRYQKAQVQSQTVDEANASRAAEDAAKQAAAAQASQVVGTGSGAVGTSPATAAGTPMTVEEAVNAAFESLNVQ